MAKKIERGDKKEMKSIRHLGCFDSWGEYHK